VLTIDTLRLQLPAGFEHRAERIARLVADVLARADLGLAGADLALDRVALPPIAIAGGASDFEIATGIAGTVRQEIATAHRQGDH